MPIMCWILGLVDSNWGAPIWKRMLLRKPVQNSTYASSDVGKRYLYLWMTCPATYFSRSFITTKDACAKALRVPDSRNHIVPISVFAARRAKTLCCERFIGAWDSKQTAKKSRHRIRAPEPSHLIGTLQNQDEKECPADCRHLLKQH